MSQQIVSNLENGSLLISDKFDINALITDVDATPYFNTIGSEYIISFLDLKNVNQLTNFNFDNSTFLYWYIIGLNSNVFIILLKYITFTKWYNKCLSLRKSSILSK